MKTDRVFTEEEANILSKARWEHRAALGTCAWICGGCSTEFPKGMPMECIHGQAACTEENERDRSEANMLFFNAMTRKTGSKAHDILAEIDAEMAAEEAAR